MAISFSRPDPSSPASVRDANFPTARRGFDQQEVREFLHQVAAELTRMQDRERFLDQELRSMRMRKATPAELDDETVARLLGEETTRIVQAARETATVIKSRAEEVAERLLREAREEAQHLREEAEAEATRRRRDAEQDADAELEMAKQQGREMVEEARAYRERVLSELSRRRDLARQQIDQLIHGRDRLVQAFERARLVAADVVAELAPLGELTEYVDLSPTTGPVPVMVPASRLGEFSSVSDETLAARAVGGPDDPALDPGGSAATAASDDHPVSAVDDGPADEQPAAQATDSSVATAEPEPAPQASFGATVLQFPERRADTVVIAAGSEAEADDELEEDAPLDTVDGEGEGESGAVELADGREADEVDDDDITANDVDDLFARLRAHSGAGEPVPDDEDAATDTAPTPFQVRDEALTPLIVSSGRTLKRVLADEQNDVLDRLRSRQAVRSIDDVFPPAAEHAARYFDAIAVDLQAAAASGASALGESSIGYDLTAPGVLAPVSEALASDLVRPLRDRLGAGIADVDGDHEELARKARAIYREWKTKRIDDALDDLLRHAYSRGALTSFGTGTPVRWAFDPSVGACSECEDNSLQGAIQAGTPFPTGHVCAPAHAGCRCLVVRAD